MGISGGISAVDPELVIWLERLELQQEKSCYSRPPTERLLSEIQRPRKAVQRGDCGNKSGAKRGSDRGKLNYSAERQ